MKKRRCLSQEEWIFYTIIALLVICAVITVIKYFWEIFLYILAISVIIISVVIIAKYIVDSKENNSKIVQEEHFKKAPEESSNASKEHKQELPGNDNSYSFVPTKRPENASDPKAQTIHQAKTSEEYETRYKFAKELPAQNINYRKKPLLTNHEYKFYCALAPIAKKYGFCVLSKIRIADLVEPTAHFYKERSNYFHYFGKIKAKHIDFALCNPENLEVLLLIELDDRTHETEKGRKRDEFVEAVYRDTGYRLLRVYDPWSLEQKIREALDIIEEYKIKTS